MLVHSLENGQYELIDPEFLSLYAIDEQELYPLTEADYQHYLRKANYLTTFVDGQFIYTDITIDLEQIKAEQQSQIWEKIKILRHEKCRAGCYITSVDKWFHSDDASRQQYIFMRTLPEIPQQTLWKTMDGSFVAMTKDLLDELSLALFNEEQQNYMNAEQHRAKMLQMENPLDYDYSTGWSKAYND